MLILLGCVLGAPGYAAAQAVPDPPVAAGPVADAGADTAPAGSATVEAIAAIVRGDYARAAALLEPQAADWNRALDPAAAFFLATLYENGLGVPQDEMRACALHLRSQLVDDLFSRLGGALARAKMLELGPDWARNCQLQAELGPNPGFAPAKFMLDSDHWVAVELSGTTQQIVATVSLRDKQATVPLAISPAAGAIFLPSVHTTLQSRLEGEAPRHFVEVAMWRPTGSSRWDLSWSLSEISGAEVFTVATKILTTMETDVPPRDLSVDLRDLVTLRPTDAGGVEYVIPNGRDTTGEAIPTVAERREKAEEGTRRKAADNKVNWKRRRDPARPPSFSYGDAEGCADLFVYGWAPGRAEAIAIRADRQLLDLTTSPRTFDLSVPQAEIEVVADVYERAQREWKFCTDSTESSVRQETWRAVGGTVTIQLSAPGRRAGDPQQYRATVQIDNAEFVNGAGQTVRSPQPIKLTAVAGPRGADAP